MSNPADSEQLRDMLDSYLHGKWNIGEYVHNIAMIDGLERRVKAYAEQYAYEYAKKIVNSQVTAVLEELEQQSRVASMCASDTYVVKSKVIHSIKERYQ